MTSCNTQRRVQSPSEQCPLLVTPNDDTDVVPPTPEGKITTIIWTVLAGVLVVGLVLMFTLPVPDWRDPFPSPESILKSAPVIDGHIGQFDLPHPFYLSVSAFRVFTSVTRFTRAG